MRKKLAAVKQRVIFSLYEMLEPKLSQGTAGGSERSDAMERRPWRSCAEIEPA